MTDFGTYEYHQISLDEARGILNNNNFISAIGHESTALLLTSLFDIKIEYNRIAIKMKQNDIAIVFSLLSRPKEGQILQIEELCNTDYLIGLLKKLK